MAFSMNHNNRAPMADINVTPLVDVMLVLLIIFMVTAPMMQQGVTVDVPQAPGSPLEANQDTKTMVITVTAQGEIQIDDKAIPESEILGKIVQAKKENPKVQVNLRGDKDAAYGKVLQIMAALTNAGITNLGMITAPKEQSAPKK
jgi:biopolymer transport protein TolR